MTVNGSTTPPPSSASFSGVGAVSNVSVNGSVVTVDLTGVQDKQRASVTLSTVSDGVNTGSISVPIDFLGGDTNKDDRVNVGDTNETKSHSGELVSFTNFRTDVNLDGRINVGDTNFVKSHSGNALP